MWQYIATDTLPLGTELKDVVTYLSSVATQCMAGDLKSTKIHEIHKIHVPKIQGPVFVEVKIQVQTPKIQVQTPKIHILGCIWSYIAIYTHMWPHIAIYGNI